MNEKVVYSLGALAAAAFGYYWFTNRSKSQAAAQPQDQGPAEAAQAYYSPAPTFVAQPAVNSQFYVNQKQAMPLPYNT